MRQSSREIFGASLAVRPCSQLRPSNWSTEHERRATAVATDDHFFVVFFLLFLFGLSSRGKTEKKRKKKRNRRRLPRHKTTQRNEIEGANRHGNEFRFFFLNSLFFRFFFRFFPLLFHSYTTHTHLVLHILQSTDVFCCCCCCCCCCWSVFGWVFFFCECVCFLFWGAPKSH